MQNLNGKTNWQIIESNQMADSFLSTFLDEQVSLRLCSVRCKEAQIETSPNQDYARIVFAKQSSIVSFCVCDGVGGSFQGNFAAKYLATRLTDYLMTLPGIPRHSHKIAVLLRKQLEIWAFDAQQELRLTSWPLDIPAFEQEILIEQRDQHGSATVFFCGRIDYASSNRSRVSQTLPALFCWMGNVTARVFAVPQACEQLGDLQNDRNRWSTRAGQQGILTVRVSALDKNEPLVIHTDGLDALSRQLTLFDDQQMQKRIWERLSLPTNDDMTVLEFRWTASQRSSAQRIITP
jgi:hypothetical protein